MSKIPEQILQAACDAYSEKFLYGNSSLGEAIERAYFVIQDHCDLNRADKKEHVFLNQSRPLFEELLLTRWHYHNDPDFEINESTGEYEDELVQMAWTGYYLAWNKWSN